VVSTGRLTGDHLLLRAARSLQRHDLVHGMGRLSELAVAIIVAALCAAAFVAVTRPGTPRRQALVLIAAVGGSLICKEIVKELVSRPAPVPNAGPDEYPSGHATTTFALGAELLIVLSGHPRRRWLIAAVVLFVGGVGVARVLLQVHYASDVFAGWALALAVVALLEVARSVSKRYRECPDRVERAAVPPASKGRR
jgi:membrane-associated phospholipid phosphatase